MKALRRAVQFCLLLLLVTSGSASATVTLSGNIQFSSLDGSAQDSDGVVNGVFTVNDDLVLDGTINCNDDPPLPGNASACQIRLDVSGDLSLTPGSGIFAENRNGGGDGGDIELAADGDITLAGPSGPLAGAVVSSGRTTGTSDRAGDITLQAGGKVEIQAGSAVSAGAYGGRAGDIEITAGDQVTVAGLIASGPGRVVLASALTGKVLDGGVSKQEGGSITIRAQTSSEPGLRVDAGGIVVSQGEKGGTQVVRLEGCGVQVNGLVAAVAKRDGPGRVVIRSGTALLIDGRDLGTAGPRQGRVRADSTEGGAAGFLVDLFASSDIQVLGPAASPALFAISATPGPEGPAGTGGTITAISLAGTLTGSGNAFDAGRSRLGNRGGTIDLRAKGAVTLDEATLRAVGDFATTSSSRKGGRIMVRSYQAGVSWTFGTGDVRPTGTAVPMANRGSIALTACSGIDLTGSQFPVLGGPVLPFPEEHDGVCSPSAPALPSGEPPLPVCNEPPVADAQAVETDEDTPVTITLTGSDPNSDPLTFTIVTPPVHGSLGPLTSPTATSVQVEYTPALNYNGPDSFTFQVDDGHGGTDTATVTLTVEPINDAPEVDAATFTVPENSPNGTSVGMVTFTDPDSGQSHTFSIINGNTGGAFAINSTTGEITVANSAALDFETTPSFSLTVQVTDDGSPVLSGSATITVNLTNANDPPVVNSATFTVAENSPNGTVIGTVTFTDPDAGQIHSFLILSGNTGGAFVINASTGAITVANSSALDFETTSGFSLTVQVTDSGTPAQSGTGVITINLTNVNEAPVVDPATFTVNENSPNGTIVGTVTFTDQDAGQSHTFSILEGNTGGAFAINPSTGGITVAGVINFEMTPSFALTVQVTDSGTPALSGTATVTIGVIDLNEPPVAGEDSYSVLGNTQLRVAGAAGTGLLGTTAAIGVLANDSDPDTQPAYNSLTLTAASGTSANGGDFTVASDGSFHYTPPAGFTGTDSFTYTLSDGDNTTIGTVMLNVSNRVWYVRDVVDEQNAAGGDGRSTDAFENLSAVEAASQASDIIFIFEGDTGTTPLSGGIVLKDGQKLWGEGIGLTVPGFGTLVDAGNKPRIYNTGGDVVSVPATVGNRQNVEIRGLDLQASGNAVDVTASGANSVSITISDNDIRGAGLEGVDLNAGSTGVLTATLNNNALAAVGNAFDARTSAASTMTIDFSHNAVVSNATGILIDGSGGGVTRITGFAGNAVSQNNVGTGISISSAIFDATPGGSYQTVSGGMTVIGVPSDGVGGAGIVMSNMAGDLNFTNLNIFADGGAGLSVAGTGAINVGAGTGMRVTVGAGLGLFEANGGPAVDVTNATVDLQPASIKSTNSPTTGVSLVNVADGTTAAVFSAGAGSSITNATGTDFNVDGGNATISYAAAITNSAGRSVVVQNRTGDTATFSGSVTDTGTGIFLNNNIGSAISFSGALSLTTGASDAFTATGGGTVTATNTTSTITTTTGIGLNVANTTIGVAGLKFSSISAGTAASGPSSGIILNNTGSSGSLTVSGTGSAGSGGTIQRTTGVGIALTSTMAPSFASMNIQNTGRSGVKGTQVAGFILTNTTINNSGTAVIAGSFDSNIAFNDQAAGTEQNLTGIVSITSNTLTNAQYHGVDITNFNGTIADLTLSSNTITSSTSSASSLGSGINLQALGSVTTVANVTKATIANNVITNFPSGAGIQALGANANAAGPAGILGTPGSANVISITGNRIAGQSAASRLGTNGILVAATGKGQANFDVSSNGTVANPLANIAGFGIGVSVRGAVTVEANVTNNILAPNNTFASPAISVGADNLFGVTDAPDLTSTISNNTISQSDGNGILATVRNSNGIGRFKIQNNTVAAPLTGVRPGIRVDSGTASGNTTVCLNMSGNTSAGSGGSQGLGLRKQGTVTTTNAFGVNGMVATSSPGVETYINGLNPAGGGTLLISATSGFSNCSLP